MRSRAIFTLLVLSVIALIVVLIHRRAFIGSWPHVYYVSGNVGLIGFIAIKTRLNFFQVKELLYAVFDFVSLIIIFVALRRFGLANGLNDMLFVISVIAYFAFYPYNKLTDAGFYPIYILMNIVASLTIYLVLSLIISYVKYINENKNIKIKKKYIISIISKSIIYTFILTILLITFGQFDPRIVLYPFTALGFMALVVLFTSFIYSETRILLLNISIALYSILIMLILVGKIRVAFSESISPTVPLVLDAFRGWYDVFHLVTGTSWILVPVPTYGILAAFLAISAILSLGLFVVVRSPGKEHFAKTLLLVMATFLAIFIFELNIKLIVKEIYKNTLFELLIIKIPTIKDILLMYRIPRFMDFTNKIFIIVILSLIYKNILLSKYNDRVKFILNLTLIILIISEIVIIGPVIGRGSVLNAHSPVLKGVRVITKDFYITDWNKEKILLEAFLREGIKVNSLTLLENRVIATNVKAFAKKLSILGSEEEVNSYYVVKLERNFYVGRPILVPQGLSLGEKVWKEGFVPIYLDNVINPVSLKRLLKLNLPILVYRDLNYTSVMLAMNMIISNKTKDTIVLAPAHYTSEFKSNLAVWSPGFVGDPHHGIFFEPKGYEYDYTYKLDFGAAQCAGNSTLRIPFTVVDNSEYYVFVRVMFFGKGTLSIKIDNNMCEFSNLYLLKTNMNEKHRIAFHWIKLCKLKLTRGRHTLEMTWIPGFEGARIYVNLVILVPVDLYEKIIKFTNTYVKMNGVSINDLSVFREIDDNIVHLSSIKIKIYRKINPLFGEDVIINIDEPFLEGVSAHVIALPIMWGRPIAIEHIGDYLIIPVPVDYVHLGILIVKEKGTMLQIHIHSSFGLISPSRFFIIVSFYIFILLFIFLLDTKGRRTK